MKQGRFRRSNHFFQVNHAPMLIAISGTDGAGKSTQVEALKGWCHERALASTHLWARGGYTPLFQFLKRTTRRVFRGRFSDPGASELRDKAMGRAVVARLWLRIAILDLILYWGVYLRLQRILRRVVICDRYIDDTRLDFRRNFPAIHFESMWLWRVLELIAPTPDVAFLLWVPVDESMLRSWQKGEPFPDDEATLAWRLRGYMDESVFSQNRYTQLDCRRSRTDIAEEIIGIVADKLGKTGLSSGR